MTDSTHLSRRCFLQNSAIAASGVLSLPILSFSAEMASIPKRKLGRTDLAVSVIGLGGGSLHRCASQKETADLIRYSLDEGVNFFDTAFNYGCGESEKRLGEALGKDHSRIVLSTKTRNRTLCGALRELEASLRRLRTDCVDLWFLHGACREDWDACFASNGVMEAMETARRQGKCRYLGVAGHCDPASLQAFLDAYPFDAVIMPLNAVDPHRLSFEKVLLPQIHREEIGVISVKALLGGHLPNSIQKDALRYALSLPVSTTLIGCASRHEMQWTLKAARTFTPLSPVERELILAQTKSMSGRPLEWYKRIS
ncbi:MAG: aldo/keto reductase [Candidatus Omnitrophota bacterium]